MSGRNGLDTALEALTIRAAIAGAERAEKVRRALADEATQLGGITATVEEEHIVLTGRGLLDRWIRDARLRGLGAFHEGKPG